jgi:hypothetical protein
MSSGTASPSASASASAIAIAIAIAMIDTVHHVHGVDTDAMSIDPNLWCS